MQYLLPRTDNAVKNRFSTLCKKRAKFEALAKENNTNSNNKRIIIQRGDNTDSTSEAAAPTKKMRCVTYIYQYQNTDCTKNIATMPFYFYSNIGEPISLMLQKRSTMETDHISNVEHQ